MKTSEREIKRFMQDQLQTYPEIYMYWGEVHMTRLGEAAADAFHEYEDEDEERAAPAEELFEIAFEVAEEYEKKKKEEENER